MVMQACTPLDAAQRIPGVLPGARLLLRAEGDANVRAVLERIDGIEAQGIAAIDVSPAYWRTLGNRLAARLALPDYTAERHAAWLAGKVLPRSEEHTSELQSLMRISSAAFGLKNKLFQLHRKTII